MRIIDYSKEYVGYVTSCTHSLTNELDEACRLRADWIDEKLKKGLLLKIAVDDDTPVGFIHCAPIQEVWGIEGEDIMVIPCLTLDYQNVYERKTGSGYGRALVEAVENQIMHTIKGIAVPCIDSDFWFMPCKFFERLGYIEVAREGNGVLMFKKFAPVENPRFDTKHHHQHTPVKNKVVIDAYWTPSCISVAREILNLREACGEHQDKIVLNEHTHSMPRSFWLNGNKIEVGPATSTERFRELILRELDKNTH